MLLICFKTSLIGRLLTRRCFGSGARCRTRMRHAPGGAEFVRGRLLRRVGHVVSEGPAELASLPLELCHAFRRAEITATGGVDVSDVVVRRPCHFGAENLDLAVVRARRV